MSSNKKPVANIEFLLEEYGLPHYRWQCVLYLIRAGNKEGIPELDDLTAAQDYLRRDIASLQKARRSTQQHLPGSRPSRSKPVSKQTTRPVNATPSATQAEEGAPAA